MSAQLPVSLVVSWDASGVAAGAAATAAALHDINKESQGSAAAVEKLNAANKDAEQAAKRATDALTGQAAAEKNLQAIIGATPGTGAAAGSGGTTGRAAAIDAVTAANQRHIRTVRTMTGEIKAETAAFKLNRAGMMELRASGINAFQALAAGMSVTQVAMMEGSQVIGAFIQGTEGGLKGLWQIVKGGVGTALGAITTPWGLVATGATAATAAFAAYAIESASSIKSVDEVLKDHKALIDEITKAYPAAAAAAKQYEDQAAKLPQPVVVADTADQAKNEKATYQSQIKDLALRLTVTGGDYGMMGDAGAKAFSDLGKGLQDGTIDAIELQKRLGELRLDPTLLAIAQAFAGSLQTAANKAALVEKTMKGTVAAAKELPNQGAYAHNPLDQFDSNSFAQRDHDRAKIVSDQEAHLAQLRKGFDAELQSINAETIAQRAAAASATILAQPIGPNGSKQERDFKAQAAATEVFAQATRQANDALRETQDALKTAGLDGYARQLEEINVQVARQIQLNPENAATWRQVGEAQKAALATNTIKSFYDPLQEQLASLKAEASSVFASDDAHRRLLTTLQAENDLRRQGIDLGSSFAEGYEHDVIALSNYAAAVGRIKDAWGDVKQAGDQAIDDLVDGLTDGTSKITDVLKNVGNDLLKTFMQLSAFNPLKNLIFNQHLPTLSDLFSPAPQAPSLSSPGLGSLGTAMNPMYVIPTTGLDGAGGPSGSLLGWLGNLFGLGGSSGGDASIGAAGKAIKSIESSGNYTALGPILASGDRAYGAYGVMGANVGPWTKQALGYAMTPEQFLASSSAQDSVFKTIFGGYMSKYGASGAAQAWFGGPGAIGKNVSDSLGTTMNEYVSRFTAAMSGATDATGIAAKGLGALGSGFDTFGRTLSNAFPAAPSSGGGGGLFGWLSGLFAPNVSAGVMAQIAAAPGGLYDVGGWTGGNDPRRVAGLVHENEFVFSAPAVRAIGVGPLDALHRAAKTGRGFAEGGYSMPWARSTGGGGAGGNGNVYLTVNNNGEPVGATATQSVDSNGDRHIEVMLDKKIDDRVLRPSSPTNRQLRSRYGLSQQVVRR